MTNDKPKGREPREFDLTVLKTELGFSMIWEGSQLSQFDSSKDKIELKLREVMAPDKNDDSARVTGYCLLCEKLEAENKELREWLKSQEDTSELLALENMKIRKELVYQMDALKKENTELKKDFLWCIENSAQLEFIRSVKRDFLEKYFKNKIEDLWYYQGGDKMKSTSKKPTAKGDRE